MNPTLNNAIAHASACMLITVYLVAFFFVGILIMMAVLILINDLVQGVKRLRGRL